MIRVLHVYKNFGPPNHGGVESFITNLVKGSQGQARHIVLTCGTAKSTEIFTFKGAVVVRVPQQAFFLSMPISVGLFKAFHKLAKRVDVVNYHFPFPLQDLLTRLVPSNVPQVVTYHSDVVRQKISGRLYAPLRDRFLRCVDKVVATSPDYLASSEVLSSLPNQPAVIPLGIEVTRPLVNHSLLDKWGAHVAAPYFLFLGGHRTYKGLDCLIRAAVKSGCRVVIAGDEGYVTKDIRQQITDAATDQVLITGSVSEAEKLALLDNCLALVLPSNMRSEAFGVVLLEAARQSKPMITTEIGTATSWVNIAHATGLVVEPNNHDELAAAMDTLRSSAALRHQFGTQARIRLERLFDRNVMAEKYLVLYRQLISQKCASAANPAVAKNLHKQTL